MLPKLGGLEVLRALKQDPVTASIPVIVLSGLAQINEARLMQEGATAYFEKAKLENADVLIDLVKRLLDGGLPQSNAAAQQRGTAGIL